MKYFHNQINMQSSLLKAYAKQSIKSMPLKEKSRFHKWKDTTTLEIKKVLALIIAMGLVSHIDVSE